MKLRPLGGDSGSPAVADDSKGVDITGSNTERKVTQVLPFARKSGHVLGRFQNLR